MTGLVRNTSHRSSSVHVREEFSSGGSVYDGIDEEDEDTDYLCTSSSITFTRAVSDILAFPSPAPTT